MKKKGKQMIIMLVVLALLVGAYFGLNAYNEKQNSKDVEEEKEYIVSLEKDSVIAFSYQYEGSEYSYKKEDGIWHYTADPTLTLTQDRLLTITEKLETMVSESTIYNVADMEQYGLVNPAGKFSFETATEKYEFYVGDYNVMITAYYVCKPGDNTVYTVNVPTITSMELDVMDIVVEQGESTQTESTT